MKDPKISVILSTYNGMPYLTGAIESILKQSYRNFELIIVDDASTDSTLKTIKKYKDNRIKIILNKKNTGLASSLNKGLKFARGEYIARMDADDISFLNRLEEQYNFLEKNKNIDVCGTWVNLIDKNDQIIGVKKYPTNNNEIKNALKWYQPLVHPTIMARTGFFNKLNGYRNKYDYAEDYDLLARSIPYFTMANIPKILLSWRQVDTRRSRSEMQKINKADLKVKIDILKNNYFGKTYVVYVLVKILTTYLVPTKIKLILSTQLKLS